MIITLLPNASDRYTPVFAALLRLLPVHNLINYTHLHADNLAYIDICHGISNYDMYSILYRNNVHLTYFSPGNGSYIPASAHTLSSGR